MTGANDMIHTIAVRAYKAGFVTKEEIAEAMRPDRSEKNKRSFYRLLKMLEDDQQRQTYTKKVEW